MTSDASILATLEKEAGTLGQDVNAAESLIKLFEDMAHHKASISEAISAGATTAKAVAQYVPGASAVVAALDAAQVLDAVYEALPIGWQFVRTNEGPLKDVFDNKTPKESIFGFSVDP